MAFDVNSVLGLGTKVNSALNDINQLAAAQTEANGLINSKLFNVGSDTSKKADLEAQQKSLQAAIETLNKKIKELETDNNDNIELIAQYEEELDASLKEIMQEAADLTEEQQKEISKAQSSLIEDLKKGEITEDEFSSKLAGKIVMLGFSNMTETQLQQKLDGNTAYKQKITALSETISDTTQSLTVTQQQLALTTVSLNTVNALLANMTEAVDFDKKYASGSSIYSPQKVDLIDFLSSKYGKGANDGGLSGLGKALDDGIIGQMYDGAFSMPEAVYAINWMFPDTGISYDAATNKFVVPWGHGTEERDTYGKLVSQLNSLDWANSDTKIANATNNGDGTYTDAAGNVFTPQVVTATGGTVNLPTDEGEAVVENEDEQVEEDRTDPIGFNHGNISYDFVVDANGDNIFNGSEEFLGAAKVQTSSLTDANIVSTFGEKFAGMSAEDVKKFDVDGDGFITGIEELLMYDTDKNGKIENEELEDLTILKTNWATGARSFTSASLAGVTSIDLSTFQSGGAYSGSLINKENWLDINNNLTQNRFNVSMSNGNTLSGYQRLDNNEYISKVYKDAYNMKYTINYDPTLDANGNIIDLNVQADSTAKDSSRKSIEDAKDALTKATADFEAENARRKKEANESLAAANSAGITLQTNGTMVLDGEKITVDIINKNWGETTAENENEPDTEEETNNA